MSEDVAEGWARLKEKGTALKEWAAMCEALAIGRQRILLRKGGIHEKGFDVSTPCFYMFPTYLHQEPEKFRPEFRELGEASQAANPGPEKLVVGVACEVVGSVSTTDRSHLEMLASMTVMTDEALALRYNWKPEQALHVLVVRAHPLRKAVELPMKPAYGGCRSWVELGPLPEVELHASVLLQADAQATLSHLRETLQS